MFGLFKKKKKTPESNKSTKDQATENGEPFFEMLKFDYNKDDPTQGEFEFDWNHIFVTKLRALGFQGHTDEQVVDNWFTNLCRGIALENYENEQASPSNRIVERTELDDGRIEYK